MCLLDTCLHDDNDDCDVKNYEYYQVKECNKNFTYFTNRVILV